MKGDSILLIEIRVPNGSWARVHGIRPRDHPGSMSDNRENGERHLVIFGCSEDRSTILRIASSGADVEIGSFVRLIEDASKYDVLATLTGGQEFVLTVHTDVARVPRTVRFTHHNGI